MFSQTEYGFIWRIIFPIFLCHTRAALHPEQVGFTQIAGQKILSPIDACTPLLTDLEPGCLAMDGNAGFYPCQMAILPSCAQGSSHCRGMARARSARRVSRQPKGQGQSPRGWFCCHQAWQNFESWGGGSNRAADSWAG